MYCSCFHSLVSLMLCLWLMQGPCTHTKECRRKLLITVVATDFPHFIGKCRVFSSESYPATWIILSQCVHLAWLFRILHIPVYQPWLPWVPHLCHLRLEQTLWKTRGLAGRESAAGQPRNCWKRSTNTLSSWIWCSQWVFLPLLVCGCLQTAHIYPCCNGEGSRARLWYIPNAWDTCCGWKSFLLFFFYLLCNIQ